MILKSVRVENFKCIEDSSEFPVDRVTCLVGKNESGKTALLQALYKLNPDVPGEGDFHLLMEYPRRKLSEYKDRHGTEPDNVLTTVWELEEEERDALAELLGPKGLRSGTVTMTKGYDNDRYWSIDTNEKQVDAHLRASAALEEQESAQVENGEGAAEDAEGYEELGIPAEAEPEERIVLNEIALREAAVQHAIDVLEEYLPTFLYFSEYDSLPGRVSIDDLRTRPGAQAEPGARVFNALLALAGTSVSEIDATGRFEALVAELEAVSNRITSEIFEYWTQNRYLDVEFRFDNARPQDPSPFNTGYVFRTRVKNRRHGVSVSFDERSAGFVWFFSFLVWFSQLKRTYGNKLTILLDDPGLALHARAQADLLRYINEKLSPEHQVIYSTHSPFMIDADNLLGVRTVEDVVEDDQILGTRVRDDVLATDPDTLFPLQGAIGYDITQTLFVGKHTLLVEGPSDLLYLKWFSSELAQTQRESLDSRWVVTPVGGIDKMFSFVGLFGGRKLHVAAFTDFHSGVKMKVRHLTESELLRKGHVFSAEMYVRQDEADTEDLLGRDLYTALVNKCYNLPQNRRLPKKKPSDAPTRVIEEVKNRFRVLPEKYPEFDHLTPALFLVENTAQLRTTLADLDQTLDRFEKLFTDLNALLPK